MQILRKQFLVETISTKNQIRDPEILKIIQNTENHLHAQINKHRKYEGKITKELAKSSFLTLRPDLSRDNFDEPRIFQKTSEQFKIMHINIKGS